MAASDTQLLIRKASIDETRLIHLGRHADKVCCRVLNSSAHLKQFSAHAYNVYGMWHRTLMCLRSLHGVSYHCV